MNDDDDNVLDHVLAPENQEEAVALARALCPFAETVTDALMLICVAMVEARGDICVVSEYLGFSRSSIRKHLQSKMAGRIIKTLAREKLTGEGYMLGVFTLMDVAASESQTGTARRNAAMALIELAQDEDDKKSDRGDETKDLNSMTLAELEGYVGSIRQDLVRIPKDMESKPLLEPIDI